MPDILRDDNTSLVPVILGGVSELVVEVMLLVEVVDAVEIDETVPVDMDELGPELTAVVEIEEVTRQEQAELTALGEPLQFPR
jgi:hypothetical protein